MMDSRKHCLNMLTCQNANKTGMQLSNAAIMQLLHSRHSASTEKWVEHTLNLNKHRGRGGD
jgi:hypothetical protein